MTHLTTAIKGQAVVKAEENTEVIQVFTEFEEEYKALRNEVGLMDLSAAGKFKVSGEDHVEYMDSIISADIEFMDIEKVVFSLLIDSDAKAVDLIAIYKQEDYILIETTASKRRDVLSILQEFKIEDLDVLIEDVTEDLAIIAFEGPYAWRVGQSLVESDITSLQFQSFFETKWNEEEIIFARIGVTGEYGYKVILPMQKSVELWNVILEKEDEDYKVLPVGQKAMHLAMLEVRQPNIEVEADHLSVLESSFEWLLNFEKEDYVGEDALRELLEEDVSKRIVGFSSETQSTITAKDSIQIEDIVVGEVLQAVYNPIEERYFGLAVLDIDFAVSGLVLESVGKESSEKKVIQTISSPYIVPKSWAIKMV